MASKSTLGWRDMMAADRLRRLPITPAEITYYPDQIHSEKLKNRFLDYSRFEHVHFHELMKPLTNENMRSELARLRRLYKNIKKHPKLQKYALDGAKISKLEDLRALDAILGVDPGNIRQVSLAIMLAERQISYSDTQNMNLWASIKSEFLKFKKFLDFRGEFLMKRAKISDDGTWFKCPDCGTEVERHPWISAHLMEGLVGACPKCKVRMSLPKTLPGEKKNAKEKN